MAKRITLRELQDRLLDPEIPEAELRDYFAIDEDRSEAFAPAVAIDPETVDDEGLEADIALRFLNSASRLKRKFRYDARRKEAQVRIRAVSEGDSWFQFPLLLDDVIDQLHELRQDMAIRSLGAAGDLLRDIVAEDELTRAIEDEEASVFLISGGGNDMVGGGRLASVLHEFQQGRKAEDYPNAAFQAFLGEIRDLYDGLFDRLTTRFPNLKIFCHGYDNAIPASGKWLGKPMAKLDIRDQRLQREIVEVLIGRFNGVLAELREKYDGSVWHVDCTGAVGADRWFDELHPRNEGYRDVALRFSDALDLAGVESVAPEGVCPGRSSFLRDARELSPGNRRRLVAHRARRVVQKGFERVRDDDRAAALREEISFTQEKIHLGRDFLPASFLTRGAERSRSVCRIRTGTSLGTGFLIAARRFIMTNNHVLPTRGVASGSVAEFELEEGREPVTARLRPDRLFLTDRALDFTIVGCEEAGLSGIEPVALLRNPMTVDAGERVNIIQHPRGRPKEIAIHENKTVSVLDRVIRYRTDTEPGSSGSAVFNNDWELVALHHAGHKRADGTALNEGIRMAAIVSHLTRESAAESAEIGAAQELLGLVPDSSPYLGFFDVAGVEGDGLEIELPDFRGTPDFADVGFWNIEHFNDSVDDERIADVADVTSRLAMDVMGLTEVQEGAMDRLAEALRDRGQNAEFELLNVRGAQDIAVLYDADTTRVELATDLSDRYADDLAVETPGGNTAFPRRPLFARCHVQDDEGGEVRFLMIVVHLKAFGDPTSRARRRLAAEVLGRVIEDIREQEEIPVILGGDFNERLNNDVLSGLTDAPDLFTLTTDDQDDNAISYVGTRHRSLIDHIIISRDVRPGDLAGDDAAIIRLDRSVADFADDVSDHVPVVMRVVLRDAPVAVEPVGEDGRARIQVPEGTHSLTLDFD
ncbi:MAG: trypsin-like peptidase domain-containing protein [Myxococcota bacterium]|nr:trypsin-like peptidase domain-containing protein [Myxococcota bacterium]